MSTATHAIGHAPPRDAQSTRKTLWGTGVGNALEWFDWNVYGTFAAYFSSQIFHSGDARADTLKTLAIFAVGFVARPFGGVFFGWIGDRFGRKHSMSFAVLTASVGSLFVALCPTYAQVGWVAALILLIGRLIQGLAHGGELPGAQTYLAEHAPNDKRGLWASSIYVTGTLGMVVGLLLGLGLQSVLSHEQMVAWGWRIPFAVGAVLGLFALWLRANLDETAVFEAHQANEATNTAPKENLFITVAKSWKTGLQVIGITAGLTVSYYIWSVTIASVAQTSFHYSARSAFTATLAALCVYMVALVFWGWLSDKVGRKPLILFAMGVSAILAIPMIKLVQGGHWWQLFVAIAVQLVVLAAFLSHAPATYAEMFPTGERTAGFGIYYAIAIAAFGGTSSYVLTWLGNPTKFAIYAMVLQVIAVLTMLTLPETKGIDLHGVGKDDEVVPA